MSIELHILPPLFSLPSISGSCIAALSLCNLVLDPSAFKVVESTDLSIGMPALKEGEIWHRGYTNIKSFLSTQHDIDTSLTEMQKADIVAWGSLVEDLGDTLAWNTLFVSRKNYLGVTRRQVSLSLPFPSGFFLPTRLRAYALRRCAEIGVTEDLEEEERPRAGDGFSDTWLTRRRTWDEKARLLKLHALAMEFYTPLAGFVTSAHSSRPFAFQNSLPTSIDALIYGYLSLHFFPPLPDPILRTIMKESHPRLVSYLQKCHEFFGVKNAGTVRSLERNGWSELFNGWGVQPGKRIEDFIGIGIFVGGILSYAWWKMIRRAM